MIDQSDVMANSLPSLAEFLPPAVAAPLAAVAALKDEDIAGDDLHAVEPIAGDDFHAVADEQPEEPVSGEEVVGDLPTPRPEDDFAWPEVLDGGRG